MAVDILLLSLGTTRGWRVADAQLVEMLRDAGASVSAAAVELGASARLRRGYPLNDVVEGYAARRALGTALARERPRAVVLGSTTAALMVRPPVPTAVWLDSPAALNRPGARNAAVHALERDSFRRASVLMPWSPQNLGFPEKTICIPPPIALPGVAGVEEREPLVVAYTPDPKAKDLELAVRAWGALISDAPLPRSAGAPRLVITGIEPDWARTFLSRRGLAVIPPGIEFAGMVSRRRFGELLATARVFLSSAAWEDFGIAPLEALAAGAALCVAAAGGPFPALGLARRLEPRFVAEDRRPTSLAAALAAALRDGASGTYREAAAVALAGYGRAETVRRLADQVLPRLL